MNALTAPATGTPLVSFRQVRKHFAVDGRRLEAIQQFDLEIGEGEFIAIVGASGCGKSTLLRLLIGLDRDYDGEIRVDGRPIAGIGGERGIVFQEHRLFPWLTVQQNVALGLVNEALGEVDLTHPRERGGFDFLRQREALLHELTADGEYVAPPPRRVENLPFEFLAC